MTQSSSHYSTTIMARTKGGVLKHSPHSRADMAKRAARKQCAKIVVARKKIPRKKDTITNLSRHTTSLAPKPVSIVRHDDSRATTGRKSMPPEHTVSVSANPRTIEVEDDLLSVDNLRQDFSPAWQMTNISLFFIVYTYGIRAHSGEDMTSLGPGVDFPVASAP